MGNEHFHHNTLQMISHMEQNNTVITCAALDTSHIPLRSDTITVIIMGKFILLRCLEWLLQWTPYTKKWPQVHIQGNAINYILLK